MPFSILRNIGIVFKKQGKYFSNFSHVLTYVFILNTYRRAGNWKKKVI